MDSPPTIRVLAFVAACAPLGAAPLVIADGPLTGRDGLVAEPLMAPGFLANRILGVGVAAAL